MTPTLVRFLNSEGYLKFERESYLEFHPDFMIVDDEVYAYNGTHGNSITYKWGGSSLLFSR